MSHDFYFISKSKNGSRDGAYAVLFGKVLLGGRKLGLIAIRDYKVHR